VIHGKRPGPTCLVSAAVPRATELIGVEIVAPSAARARSESVAGHAAGDPVVNSLLLKRSRLSAGPSATERCFPGHPSGSLGSRLAHIFLNDVVRAVISVSIYTSADPFAPTLPAGA